MQRIWQRYGNNPRAFTAQRIANTYNKNLENAFVRREAQRHDVTPEEYLDAIEDMDSKNASRWYYRMRNNLAGYNDYSGKNNMIAAKGNSNS